MDLKIGGVWAADIGPSGYVGDLSFTTRYGDGAAGMFEATWRMDLDPTFDHPALRRGQIVELMVGSWRVGSSLILNEPNRGGPGDAWSFTASGVGREAERDHGYYCLDASGNMTARPDVAIDRAIDRGLPWADRHSSVPTTAFTDTADELNTVGALLNSASDELGQRWGIGQDNIVRFYDDPTTPTYHVQADTVSLAPADDNYASTVLLRYRTTTGGYDTVDATNADVEEHFGHREFPFDATGLGPISTVKAQALVDGILAKAKGRMGWANTLTLVEGEIRTDGDVPAGLSILAEEAGEGVMVRLHGIFNDLLAFNGQTWLDIIVAEAKYAPGTKTIEISPLGLVTHTMQEVAEKVTGLAA